jgi:hypothetical protein
MQLPLLHPRLIQELNIGLEIPLKIGLPLTGLPSTVDLPLPHQVASKVALLHMAHLPVQMHMAQVLQLEDQHPIQLEVGLQFRWLPSEVLPHPLLILSSQLKLLKPRQITLIDNKQWN